MGNKSKLISGIILLVIGIVIAYEANVYNLLDMLLVIGFIIAIVGVILILIYFIDNNADRTNNLIKDFLSSNQRGSNSKQSFSNGPLKMRKNDNVEHEELRELNFDDIYTGNDDGGIYNDYADSRSHSRFFTIPEENPKAVLNMNQAQDSEVDLDKPLDFTPYYGRPLKITRAPKKRDSQSINQTLPYVEDKSDEIQKVLLQDEPVPINNEFEDMVPEQREIKIDVNNPESLPVPKALKGSIVTDDGLLSSQEAFDQLSVNVNKEVMLEIPSLNELSDRFLSHVPTIYSRVIIDEFDLSDMSYTFLISSLLKQGVHIKTVPHVHTTNLITDDAYAMIISQVPDGDEYGAIFNDLDSISNIRSDFEKTWSIASNLDEDFIMASMQGVN